MAQRLKVYDDYYVNAMFEDPRVKDYYYRNIIQIEYGPEGYVLIFNNRIRSGALYIPFFKHRIPVVLEDKKA